MEKEPTPQKKEGDKLTTDQKEKDKVAAIKKG
jgi:hypothetical protein